MRTGGASAQYLTVDNRLLLNSSSLTCFPLDISTSFSSSFLLPLLTSRSLSIGELEMRVIVTIFEKLMCPDFIQVSLVEGVLYPFSLLT